MRLINPTTLNMVQKSAYDYLIRLIIIGDSRVGKTCFLDRFAEDRFLNSHMAIGFDAKTKMINIEGMSIKLRVWDTVGQGRLHYIPRTIYKSAMGIILLYDCCNENSFNNIRNWVEQIEEHANTDVAILLIGNKCDRPDKKIDPAKGNQLADEYGMTFFETSAKCNLNVHESFYYIAKQIKEKQREGERPIPGHRTLNVAPMKKKVRGGGCC